MVQHSPWEWQRMARESAEASQRRRAQPRSRHPLPEGDGWWVALACVALVLLWIAAGLVVWSIVG